MSRVVSRISQREIPSMPRENEAWNGRERLGLSKVNWKPVASKWKLHRMMMEISRVARLMSSAQDLAAATGRSAPIRAPAAGTIRRMRSSGFIVSIHSVHKDKQQDGGDAQEHGGAVALEIAALGCEFQEIADELAESNRPC